MARLSIGFSSIALAFAPLAFIIDSIISAATSSSLTVSAGILRSIPKGSLASTRETSTGPGSLKRSRSPSEGSSIAFGLFGILNGR